VLLVVLASATAGTAARADANAECAATGEHAQSLRGQHRLLAAREQLVTCARDACPQVVRRFCTQWLSEVEAALPSLVVRAHDDRGRDVIGVRVSLDGKPVRERLDGAAIPVDPGPHRIRYEAASGETVEDQVLVVEGEHDRVLTVGFGARLRPDGTPEPELPPPPQTVHPPPTQRAEHGSGTPALLPAGSERSSAVPALVTGAAGVVALGVFAYLDVSAWNDYQRLGSGCGHSGSCSQGDVDSLRTRFVGAGISLGVGVVALGVATWMLLSRPSASDAPSVARRALAPLVGVRW
jgi:hypothetical protein